MVMSKTEKHNRFAERLREARIKRGITQQAAADMFMLSLRGYCRWESGEREPSLDAILMIAHDFDVSLDWLLGRTDVDVFDERNRKD